MDTIWLLQDATDYHPSFEAVFATREAAEAYMAAQERWRHKPEWMLTEEPVYTTDVQPAEQM